MEKMQSLDVGEGRQPAAEEEDDHERGDHDHVGVFGHVARRRTLKPEYSVWKPALSSDSASGRSKGARLSPAMPEIQKTTKETGSRNPYQMCADSWRRTISTQSWSGRRRPPTGRSGRPESHSSGLDDRAQAPMSGYLELGASRRR